jgi:restriction endonuclease S subunit
MGDYLIIMSNNWQTKKLGEVCEIKKGKKPQLFSDIKKDFLPYLSAKFMRGTKEAEYADIEDKNSVPVKEEDLVIICDGSNSGDIFSGFKGVLSSTMGRVDFDTGVIEKSYLESFLKKNFELFNKGKKGAAIPHLDFSVFKSLEIPLPSLEEQKRIVKILDEKLGVVREAISLRESALADTEKILYARLREIFEKGKEEGWEDNDLGEVVDLKRKSNSKILPYVGMEDIKSVNPSFYGNLENREVKSNTYHFTSDAVLYGRLRPYLNKVMLPDFEGHCSTEIFPLYGDKAKIDRKFLWYWLVRKKFVDHAMETTTGARMPRADIKKILKFKIYLPKLTSQRKIVAELDKLSERIDKLRTLQREQLTDLKRLEKAYLREAFNGEL